MEGSRGREAEMVKEVGVGMLGEGWESGWEGKSWKGVLWREGRRDGKGSGDGGRVMEVGGGRSEPGSRGRKVDGQKEVGGERGTWDTVGLGLGGAEGVNHWKGGGGAIGGWDRGREVAIGGGERGGDRGRKSRYGEMGLEREVEIGGERWGSTGGSGGKEAGMGREVGGWREVGGIMYRVEDMFGRERTGVVLYCRYREIILEIGAEHVVAICTDNALANKEAYHLLRGDPDGRLRDIAMIHCAAHCCNLMLMHIAGQPWVVHMIAEGRDITLFFQCHAWAANLLSRQSPTVSLIRPGETWYGTSYIMLQAAAHGDVASAFGCICERCRLGDVPVALCAEGRLMQGASHRVLRDIAMRCLGVWTTASPCERNWSTHDFIQTKRRNWLGVEQLEKLVFCHWNLKLLKSSRAHEGFIGAGFHGVGLTNVERRAEDFPRYEPDEMAPGTYVPTKIEREVDRLRRQSRGKRLARVASALAHQIQPYRGDGFLERKAPMTMSPASRVLPPRAADGGVGVPVAMLAPEACSHNLPVEDADDMLVGTDADDKSVGGSHSTQAARWSTPSGEAGTPGASGDEQTSPTRYMQDLPSFGAQSPASGAVGETGPSPCMAADAERTMTVATVNDTMSAAATFSSPYRAVERCAWRSHTHT
ncbi:hypothetical protein CBR_g21103 [Chara braunii]|uniref:DUF659 domain-containing protein n=1 Tax=Chara braunii TaxID=69332 RepID=A0A388L0S6_CHABU|nr:hypothetical protein CBR_g21103 [Chara braunii]|eukprot:GBG75858.1 hypothetical protein CBR_g21103 [Chara braunii]